MTNGYVDEESKKRYVNTVLGKIYVENLYVENEENAVEIYNYDDEGKQFLFDPGTGNFHILPKDKELIRNIARDINCKADDIIKCLKEKAGNIKVKRAWGRMKNFPEGYCDKAINSIFQYISITNADNIACDMMFNRFEILNEQNSSDYNINCTLKALQYSKGIGVKSYQLYPCHGNPKGSIQESIYINPNINFGKEAELIAQDFLEFCGITND